jgi:hypothetical protein
MIFIVLLYENIILRIFQTCACRLQTEKCVLLGPYECSGNLKYKFTLSDSVWAVLRTKIQARNAMLANRPAEHTAVDFFHQPAIDRSSKLTIADDHVAVSAMLKNRREPLWYSFAALFGFSPRQGSETSHLDPHKVDLKLRWRPAAVPAFEHSLFFLSASSSFLKSRKDYGSVTASFVSRFNRDWYFGLRLEADLNQKSSTGRQANSLPLDIAPRLKVGTLYAWEDQLITCKLNATVTPRVTEVRQAARFFYFFCSLILKSWEKVDSIASRRDKKFHF